MSNTMPDNEADFIAFAHDRQMDASSPTAALFFRMHKEMTPAVVRMLTEAIDSPNARRAAATLLFAYAQHVASTLVALASSLTDDGAPDQQGRMASVAKTVAETISIDLQKYLEHDKKKPI